MAGHTICFIAHLIIQGANFGSHKPSTKQLFWRGKYGINIPQLRNIMTRDAFICMRRHIHFCNNHKRKAKGKPGHNPLFKVKYFLDAVQLGLAAAWVAGKHVCIDKSMVKHISRTISFKYYIPAKPIKHSIKVCCLCCAYTGVVLAFKVYLGKEDFLEGTSIDVCLWLLVNADILKNRGRVLYTINYYTSVKFLKVLYKNHGWVIVGTILPTNKKKCNREDFPFANISNGASNMVPRGWYREAAIKLKTPTGRIYYIHATTWQDKKQVFSSQTRR